MSITLTWRVFAETVTYDKKFDVIAKQLLEENLGDECLQIYHKYGRFRDNNYYGSILTPCVTVCSFFFFISSLSYCMVGTCYTKHLITKLYNI